VRLGQWVVDHAFDPVGLGGYTFGVDPKNQRIVGTKSGEHIAAVHALFTNLLAPLTGDAIRATYGAHARQFLERLWNAAGGFFHVGSNDGSTINDSVIAQDVQSWAYLTLLDPAFAAGLDWAKTNLATTDTPYALNSHLQGRLRLTGVSLSTTSRRAIERSSAAEPEPNPDAVFCIGTSQLATALLARRNAFTDLPTFHGDFFTAGEYLSSVELGQAELTRGQTVNGIPLFEGRGIVAASSVLNTGFGFSYRPFVHLGATSWYLYGARAVNPFHLLDQGKG
jgi:hypothetical protein